MTGRFIIVFCILFIATAVPHAQANKWHPPDTLKVSEPFLSDPHDVALSPDGLYLLVADNGNDAVEILVPGALTSIGQLGPGTFKSPHDVAFGKGGLVYVADTANGRIAVWKFDGVTKYAGVLAEYVEEWTEGIIWPEGVVVAPSGRAYVTDVRANALLVLEGGVVINRITQAAGQPFERPHDVDLDGSGNIYLTDPGNNRIVIFNPDLTVKQVLDGDAYGFDEPKYLGLDSDGMLFVADEGNDRVRILSSGDFRPISDIASGKEIDDLDGPEGVTVSGRYIWISDTSNDRIILLRRHRK